MQIQSRPAQASTAKEAMQAFFTHKLDDEDVIHYLVDLRRLAKKGQLGEWKPLYDAMVKQGAIQPISPP